MKFGAKIVILLSMLFSSIGTFLTPPIANLDSPALLIVLRFLIGFVHVNIYKQQLIIKSNNKKKQLNC